MAVSIVHKTYNPAQIADKILSKYRIEGELRKDLRKELITLASSSWEQAQTGIIQEIKKEFRGDGISVLLERIPYSLLVIEGVEQKEMFFHEKD